MAKIDATYKYQGIIDATLYRSLDNTHTAILLRGEPGVGKTHLAERLRRNFINEDEDLSQADFIVVQFHPDTGKEVLYLISAREMVRTISPRGTATGENVFLPSPILEAMRISHTRKVVLLLDEVDKAPPETLNYFLSFFSEKKINEITVMAMNDGKPFTMNPKNLITVMTSNDTKPLPLAMQRRATPYLMEFPDRGRLAYILQQMAIRDLDFKPLDDTVLFLAKVLLKYRSLEPKKTMVQNEMITILSIIYNTFQASSKSSFVPANLAGMVRDAISDHPKDIDLLTEHYEIAHIVGTVWANLLRNQSL